MATEQTHMTEVNYEDFRIQFTSSGGTDDVTVTVAHAPTGTGAATRLTRDELAQLKADAAAWLGSNGGQVRGGHEGEARASADHVEVLDDEFVGQRLYRALFKDAVGDALEASLHRLAGRTTGADDYRLRVSLEFGAPPETGETQMRAADAAGLPWELLHGNRVGFLATSDKTVLVRRLLDAPRKEWQERGEALTVLFFMSDPNKDLGLDEEEGAVLRQLESFDPDRRLRPKFIKGETFEQLQERLRKEDYDVIHFMGHGRLGASEGELLFHADEHGAREDWRPASQLCRLLAEERRTRLVTLNACQTSGHGSRPFAGIAEALSRDRGTSVVAMQFPVHDESARRFSACLYAELARGAALEHAVYQGRIAIQSGPQGRVARDWATPVLFLAEGQPFGRTGGGARVTSSHEASHPRPNTKRRVAIGVAGVLLVALLGWGVAQLRSDTPVTTSNVEGTVVDPVGAPLGDILVRFGNRDSVRTTSDGTFTAQIGVVEGQGVVVHFESASTATSSWDCTLRPSQLTGGSLQLKFTLSDPPQAACGAGESEVR